MVVNELFLDSVLRDNVVALTKQIGYNLVLPLHLEHDKFELAYSGNLNHKNHLMRRTGFVTSFDSNHINM